MTRSARWLKKRTCQVIVTYTDQSMLVYDGFCISRTGNVIISDNILLPDLVAIYVIFNDDDKVYTYSTLIYNPVTSDYTYSIVYPMTPLHRDYFELSLKQHSHLKTITINHLTATVDGVSTFKINVSDFNVQKLIIDNDYKIATPKAGAQNLKIVGKGGIFAF